MLGRSIANLRKDIRDSGGGIAPENLERVFDPYFSTKEMGTGIGLYMSKMIVEKSMGGHIQATNIDGGAAFTVRCPLP
jgi:signal transduction histidine kinase